MATAGTTVDGAVVADRGGAALGASTRLPPPDRRETPARAAGSTSASVTPRAPRGASVADAAFAPHLQLVPRGVELYRLAFVGPLS